MADIRIKDLATTATTTASDDFMAVDGSTNGTRKMNAAAPAFLTSVTTPSLTSPASTNLTLGLGTGGTALTLTSSTLAATFAGNLAVSGTTISTAAGGGGVAQLNFLGTTGNLNAQIQYDQINSNTGQILFGTNLAGTFATRLTLTSTAATFGGAVTASGSALVQSGTADPFINIKATADTYNPYLQFEGWNRSFFVGVRDTGGDGLFSIAATSALTSPLFSLAVVGGAATFSGAVTVSSTTAGSAGAGALVVTGGLATGDASYFGGAVTAAGTLRATNGNLYTYGESGDTTTGALFFNSAANNYIYGSGSQLAVYTAGALRATIASTGATFAGAVTAPAAGYSVNASGTYGMSLLQIDNSLDRLGLTAGASVSGATFTARYAAPMVVRMAPDVGVFQICVDSGKTIGNAYTPTGQLEISSTSSTFSGTVIVPAATASLAPLRIPHGTAPTSPTNGDMWTTTAGLYIRINGATVGPLS